MFRLESRSSNFTPANLNPRHSGSTLAKILEGKYPSVEIKAKAKVPAKRIVSKKIAAEKEKDLDRVYNNVLREDSDDVSKETVKKGIGTLQRNPISGIGPEAVTTSVKKRSRRELVPFEEILHRELVPIGR